MLDFKDVQGNILRGYKSFPRARFLYFKFKLHPADGPKDGRDFLTNLLKSRLITPADWGTQKPTAASNIGISMAGLRALQLNSETLASFPAEFRAGMRARAEALGDVGESDPKHWDKPWTDEPVHVVLTCYGPDLPSLNARCSALQALAANRLVELKPSQDAGLLTVCGQLSRKEHFGFEDGLSNPDIENVPGGNGDLDTGNVDERGRLREVPVGEFLLGHRGEGGEVSPMPRPPLFVHNGTFLVLRKLHQEVVRFRDYLKEEAQRMMAVDGCLPPAIAGNHGKVAEYLAAKMMGRWQDGSPLDLYPDAPAGHPTNAFTYADDRHGVRCPVGAHVRRANPRDSLGFAGHIISRRRMLRRGIAYGDYLPYDAPPDEAERGIMFLSLNASIGRQFEFIQRQWMTRGDEFDQGDDSDPITGTRYRDGRMVVPGQPFSRAPDPSITHPKNDPRGRLMIQGDQRTGRIPYLCSEIPNFVITKGGEYFFMPSMTGLVLLASGNVSVE
jgi:Dyp-type peroxidase family